MGHAGGYRQRAMRGTAAVPLFAVECGVLPWPAADVTIQLPGLATIADQSGERDERTIPWHTAIRETARRPAGFVEGNRGIPQPRRDDRPALGEAGGDARSPAPAGQDRFGLRVSGGVGHVGARSESSSSTGEREQCPLAQSPCTTAALGDMDVYNQMEGCLAAGGGGRCGDWR